MSKNRFTGPVHKRQCLLYVLLAVLIHSALAETDYPDSAGTCAAAEAECASQQTLQPGDVQVMPRVELSFAESDQPASPDLLADWRLEPYAIFSSDIEFVVVDKSGRNVRQMPPEIAAFKGYRGSDPKPRMSLTIGADGDARGILFDGSQSFALSGFYGVDRDADGFQILQLQARQAEFGSEDTLDAQSFCSANQLLQLPSEQPVSFAEPPTWFRPGEDAQILQNERSTIQFAGYLNIETDHELYLRFQSVGGLVRYIADLVLGASVIYEHDMGMNLFVGHLRVWPHNNDPWNQPNNSCQLHQLARHYEEQMAHIHKITVQMLSGTGNGGIAWINTFCRNPINAAIPEQPCSGGFIPGGQIAGPYGLSRVNGLFDPNGSSMVGDLHVFAHELGHTVGADHTHCWSGSPIDECWNVEPGCYAGPTSLPGPSGQGSGTIMSYCNNRGPDYTSNIGFSLGRNHPYGNLPDRVPDLMQSRMQFVFDNAPWCADPEQLPDRRLIGIDKLGQGRVYTEHYVNPLYDLDCGDRCAFALRTDMQASLLTHTTGDWISTGFAGCNSSGVACQAPDHGFCWVDPGTEPREVTAIFEPAATLTVNVIAGNELSLVVANQDHHGCQKIICGPEGGDLCSTKLVKGDSLTLGRTSFWPDNPYYRFIGWHGDCEGRDLECELELSEHRVVTAEFGERAIVRVYTYGDGVFHSDNQNYYCPANLSDRPEECDVMAERDSEVVLNAVTLAGRYFIGWQGNSGEPICPESAECSVTASPVSQNARAHFSSGPANALIPGVTQILPGVGPLGPHVIYYIDVPTGTEQLTVSLENNCGQGFCGAAKLLVRQGHPASLTTADCEVANGEGFHGEIASCTLHNPSAGRHYASIRDGLHAQSFMPGSLLSVELEQGQNDLFADRFETLSLSCTGHCEGPHPDGDCFCDAYCHEFDDCCPDVCSACSEVAQFPGCNAIQDHSLQWPLFEN
jgi:hypothetical protein